MRYVRVVKSFRRRRMSRTKNEIAILIRWRKRAVRQFFGRNITGSVRIACRRSGTMYRRLSRLNGSLRKCRGTRQRQNSCREKTEEMHRNGALSSWRSIARFAACNLDARVRSLLAGALYFRNLCRLHINYKMFIFNNLQNCSALDCRYGRPVTPCKKYFRITACRLQILCGLSVKNAARKYFRFFFPWTPETHSPLVRIKGLCNKGVFHAHHYCALSRGNYLQSSEGNLRWKERG